MAKKIPITLNFEDYRDRVYACWTGKNIGGTMGGPFEGKRELLDIQGFVTEKGEPLPNDDLDLQLVWLHAIEHYGPLAIDAALLGELWVEMIPASWNEYGIGKNNIRRGMHASLAGDYENTWKHSNGAWIRTEVWACLAPGAPAIAAKYAMEDAKVDHGSGEGTTAAAFVAAMQSAAFLYNDIRKCIDIGLSAIPEESRMADSVRYILNCFDEGKDWATARNEILERNADIGDGWFEAPSNVAYALIGLLWGKGDFKKSMITAINCGDDTDCTAATVGATLGIMGGKAAIPADWEEYIGDKIINISLNKSYYRCGGKLPKTCAELSERVIKQAPFVLLANRTEITLGEELSIPEEIEKQIKKECVAMLKAEPLSPFTAFFKNPLISATLQYEDGMDISPLAEKKIKVVVRTSLSMGNDPKNLSLRWWLPEGFSMKEGRLSALIPGPTSHHPDPKAEFSFTIAAGEQILAKNRCVLEIDPEGRSMPLYIPVIFMA